MSKETVHLPAHMPSGHAVATVRAIRYATGLHLRDAKAVYNQRPIDVICVDEEAAQNLLRDLTEMGVEATMGGLPYRGEASSVNLNTRDAEDLAEDCLTWADERRRELEEDEDAGDDPRDVDMSPIIDEVVGHATDAVKLAILEAFGERDLREPIVDLTKGWRDVLGQLAANALRAEVSERLSKASGE